MFDYLLTIRVPFKCEDDVDARKEAKALIEDSDIAFKGDVPEYKLQRLNSGKPPEKVAI
jgi:hypothetical protein